MTQPEFVGEGEGVGVGEHAHEFGPDRESPWLRQPRTQNP